MTRRQIRAGFTLVEILLVLGIVVLLATLLVPLALRMQDRSNIPQGVQVIEQAIAEAKARAKLEKRVQGIRLLAMENQQRQLASGAFVRWYDSIQFIEDPGPFAEGFVWAWVEDPVPAPGATKVFRMPSWLTTPFTPETYVMANPPTNVWQIDVSYLAAAPTPVPRAAPNVVFGPFEQIPANPTGTPGMSGHKQINPFSFLGPASLPAFVNVGDFLEINGIGQLFRITAVSSSQTAPVIVPTRLTLDRALPHDIQPPLNGYPNYKIHRQPRPVPNKPVKKLPRECIVDMQPPAAATNAAPNVFPDAGDRDAAGALWIRGVSRGIPLQAGTLPPAAQNAANTSGPIDLLFSPTGELVRPAGQSSPDDIVYLWVHTYGNPDAWQAGNPGAAGGNVDNQALVVIYARTGQVASFPVNHVFTGPPGDPWATAKQGRAQGMGGM